MTQRIRRRGTTGSGGVVAQERDTPAAYGEGGPTTTSLTLSAIPELSIAIPASEGDVLLVMLSGTFGTNGGIAVSILFNYTVDGVAQFPDNLEQSVSGPSSNLVSWTDVHVVTAGEITAGEVTVVPVWASSNGAINIRPVFNVVNLGAMP